MARRHGKYPVTIKHADPENEDRPVWYAKGEKAKVDSIQSQVKTDFLFIVWTGRLSKVVTQSSQGGGSVTYVVGVVGNVVFTPGGGPFGIRFQTGGVVYGSRDIPVAVPGTGGLVTEDLSSDNCYPVTR